MIDKYKNYKNMSISTMTKGEQLVLLFDEILKKLTLAKMLITQKKIEEARVALQKCIDIFNYLMVCLDSSYEISAELMEMYAFLNGEIIKASVKQDVTYIDGIMPIVRELRDTWDEANKLIKVNKN